MRFIFGGTGPSRPAIRIAFWGNFGTLNLGNECTLAAAIDGFRRRFPQAWLISICREPQDTASRHGVAAVPMTGKATPADTSRQPKVLRRMRRVVFEISEWRRAFRHASQLDALLITGTGVLADDGHGSFGLPYEMFKWALLTKLRRRKVLFVSVGVEGISRPLARFFVKCALRLADYRCYRDVHSVTLIRSLGFRGRGDTVYPDLAFSLQELPSARERKETVGRVVAVGLYNYHDGGGLEYTTYIERVCSLMMWLVQHGYRVRVVVGDLAYDEGVRVDVRKRLRWLGLDLESSAYGDEPAASFEQLLEQLAGVDFVIASRFHNVLLALLLGKPVISLSYEAKNEALMTQMGLGAYCQRLDELNLERLIEQFGSLEQDAESLSALIASRTAANRTRVEEQYDLLASLIGGAETVVAESSPANPAYLRQRRRS